MSGFTENKIIVMILQQAFFKSKSSLGVKFTRSFHPIALVTLALIHSIVSIIYLSHQANHTINN